MLDDLTSMCRCSGATPREVDDGLALRARGFPRHGGPAKRTPLSALRALIFWRQILPVTEFDTKPKSKVMGDYNLDGI